MTAAVPAPLPPWRGPSDVPAGSGPRVATIEVFDGVHRGHARLIGRAVGLGRELARGTAVPVPRTPPADLDFLP